MEIYDCKVLVGGSRNNEVRKRSVTAAEIVMLRYIHGDDSVIDLAHVGTSDISASKVREVLALTYGPGDVDTTRAGPAILKEVFGPVGVALPTTVEGVALRPKPKKIPVEQITRWRETSIDSAEHPAYSAPVEQIDPNFAD